MAGVKVGEDAMLGAMGVATHDVPPHAIWGGVPAREIKGKNSLEVLTAKIANVLSPGRRATIRLPMGTPEIVLGICEFVVLLFALSLHESAHGWMASRLGDQTARMLGRITLNPIKHIDPVGTIMLPLVAMVTHIPLIGWAKPTPVNTRNFKNFVRDDILTTLAGPVSNVIGSVVSLLVLIVIAKTSPVGLVSVRSVAMRGISGLDPQLLAVEPGGLSAGSDFLYRHAAEPVSGRIQSSSPAAARRKPHLPPHAALSLAAGL